MKKITNLLLIITILVVSSSFVNGEVVWIDKINNATGGLSSNWTLGAGTNPVTDATCLECPYSLVDNVNGGFTEYRMINSTTNNMTKEFSYKVWWYRKSTNHGRHYASISEQQLTSCNPTNCIMLGQQADNSGLMDYACQGDVGYTSLGYTMPVGVWTSTEIRLYGDRNEIWVNDTNYINCTGVGMINYTEASRVMLSKETVSTSYNSLFDNVSLSTFEVTNVIPTINSVRIDPTPIAYNDQDLQGYCNASDSDSDNIIYEYNIFKNNLLISNLHLILNYSEDSESFNYDSTANYFFINYSITNNYNIWQLKHGTLTTYNYTIDQLCYYNNNTLELRIYSYCGIGNSRTQPQCYNGSNWVNIGNLSFSSPGSTGTTGDCSYYPRLYDGSYSSGTLYAAGCWRLNSFGCSDSLIYEEALFKGNLNTYNESIEQNLINISSINTSIDDSYILSCRAYDGNSYSAWSNSTATNITARATLNIKYSTGDLINTSINITNLDTSESYNVSTGTILLNLSTGLRNFSITSYNNVFTAFNTTINITTETNQTFNLTVNETYNIITFNDATSGTPIDNATVTVTFPSSATLELTTNSSGQINFSYINAGILEFGDYSYFFDKYNYYNLTLSDTINESNIPHTRTYNITRANLIINIYDSNTEALITQSVSVSLLELFNETTTTGQIIKNNLSLVAGEYTLYASSDGYKTGLKIITLSNKENYTVNFYLVNNSLSNKGTIYVKTKDSFYRDITGAKVTLLEYKQSELSFVSVDECLTNINAECSLSVELDTKVYYIRATAIIDGTLYIAETDQDGEIFTVNNDIRELIFYTRTEFTVSSTTNLIYDIDESFINNISSISVDFFTLDGNALEVCIEYFKEVNNLWVSVTNDTYCLESSSALQNVGTAVTLNRSNKYKAEVYINQGYHNTLETFIYPSDTSISSIFDNNYKSAIIILFWIVILAVSLHQKNITLFFILAIIVSWLELAFFPLFTIATISVFKTIVSLIGIYISRKRQDSS